MAALLRYARVSTEEQELALQHDALPAAGCLRTFSDTASGAPRRARRARPAARPPAARGDTLVVWRLDRLGRSPRHLIDTVTALAVRGVGFRSLQESIDTTTPGGRLIFHVFAVRAEFERDLVRERTRAGLVAARARGRKGGQAMTPAKLEVVREMYSSRQHTIAAIARWSASAAPPSTARSPPVPSRPPFPLRQCRRPRKGRRDQVLPPGSSDVPPQPASLRAATTRASRVFVVSHGSAKSVRRLGCGDGDDSNPLLM